MFRRFPSSADRPIILPQADRICTNETKSKVRSQIEEVKRAAHAGGQFHVRLLQFDFSLLTFNHHPMPPPTRVLALDVGSKRIGVAVSDPLGITAQGLETIQRHNKRKDMETLGRLLKDYAVREVVVGLPLRLSGAEGTQSEKMRSFASDIESRFGVTVHLWDERWTSTEANRLLRETELSIEKRGRAIDRMAAILILQSWMEAHKR
jgi:putative pre-16S rRNA nuclease